MTRNILPRTKDGAYVLNLDAKNSKKTHWVLLFIYKNTAVYFDFFRIEHISQEVLKKLKINHILTKCLGYKIKNLLCVDSIVPLWLYACMKGFCRLY